MTRITLPLGLALAVSLLGCSGSNPATPSDSAPNNTPTSVTVPTVTDAHLGSPMGLPDAPLMPAALWTLDIDPTTLTASVRSSEERAAVAMGDTYLLDIAHFFARTPLAVTQVERVFDRLRVRYTITHPIPPASNLDAPASATNRADLGVTGITMFLVDAKPEHPVYFPQSDRPIAANPTLIPNADGYFFPGAMVNTGSVANAFPYRRLVDDSALGSRLGQLNTILGVGNFGVQTGWQRNTIGDDHMGWTGYGALHQGQTSENAVEFLLDEIGTSPISLQVALIVRYTNPVGGSSAAERIANRLPPAVKDPAKFMYRMPQGAWDLERLSIEAIDGELNGRAASQHVMHLRVVDWDALATETTHAKLGDEPLANRVGQGQSGLPTFSISMPELGGFVPFTDIPGGGVLLSDDSGYGGDVGPDTGRADDPLYFRLAFNRQPDQLTEERAYTGMIRVKDAAQRLASDIVLDGQLAPLTGVLPLIEAFQVFTMNLSVLPIPLSVTVLNEPVPSGQKMQVAFEVPAVPVELHTVKIDWDKDGFFEAGPYDVNPSRELNSPAIRKNLTAAPLIDQFRVAIYNTATGAYEERDVSYDLGPNNPPTGSVTLIATRQSAPATFELDIVQSSDPEGDPRGWTITNDVTDEIINNPERILNQIPIIDAPNGEVTFTVWLTDPSHPGMAGTQLAPIVCRADPPGIVGWNRQMGEQAVVENNGGLEVDSVGNIYCFGWLPNIWDFGGGMLSEPIMPAAYLVSYAPDGTYRWGKTFSSDAVASLGELPVAIAVADDGDIVLAMNIQGSIDFGGGTRTSDWDHVFYVQLDPTGTYVRDFNINARIDQYPEFALEFGPAGEVVAAGLLQGPTGTADFGGGPRPFAGAACGFIVQHDAVGTYQWDRVYQGGWTELVDVSVSTTGDIYAAGTHGETVDYGGGSRSAIGSAPLVVALGTDGSYRWDRVMDPNVDGYDRGTTCLATSQQPGVLIAGDANSLIDLGNGPGAYGGFLVQLDPDGEWQWEARQLGFIKELVEKDGAIAGVGVALSDIELGPVHYDVVGTNDAFAVSFTNQGNFRWGTVWAGSGREFGEVIAATPTGDFILGGVYDKKLDIDTGPLNLDLPDLLGLSSFLLRVDGDTGLF